VRGWIAAQEAYADSVMGPDTPLRAEIRERLRTLMDAAAVGTPRRAGEWEYFTLRRTGEEVAAIYRRRAPKGSAAAPDAEVPVSPDSQYELVVNPLELRDDATTSVGIEGFSPDGGLMLYSVRDGGPDETSVRVRDLAAGRDLPDSLPNALYASLSFAPDGRGIYYVHRSRTGGPRFRYHRLGSDVATDSTLYGEGLAPTAFLNVASAAGGRYRIYTIGHGWARNEVHLQDTRSPAAVRIVTQGLDAHFKPQFIDGALWTITDLAAPKGRLVVIDPAKPDTADWKVIIPEGEDVLDSFTRIGDKLYVSYLHNVSSRIRAFTLDGTPAGEIDVPDLATASIRGAGKEAAYLTVASFTQPSITYKVNLKTGERSVWEAPRIAFDTTGVEVRQVWYTSKDGTRAPMFLMQKRGAARSADTPALLHGYGGFAVSLGPRFDPRAVLWVERGGIYAQATLRGGNEFGEEWHKGGMLGNKQNVFDDFISAAQYLVDSGYTSPRRLAIRGGSNGGLLMGAAVTQRPELFRAAFIGVPDLDLVRFPSFVTHNNMPALLEYGDATKPEEFAAIRKFSPYQNIREGERYPAMMVQTGINDTRVPPWQARRFAARMQEATRSGLPVILYHDLRSGHAGGRSMQGTVDLATKEMEFLLRMVGGS
jgi:prolyl oligopeptidase